MVALFRLFQAQQVSVQASLVCPRGAVDTLQLFVFGVATPIGPSQLGELECFEESGVGHVRATAHVHILLVVVQAHCGFIGHVVNQTQLVFFCALGKQRNGIRTGGDFFDDCVVLRN